MLTEKAKCIERYKADIKNASAFKTKIKDLYHNELNETIDKILLKPESEFMRILSTRIRSLLSQEYSEEIYDDPSLVTLLHSIEKEVYLSLYKKVKLSLNQLLNKKNLIDITQLSFRKHCNYQGEAMLHQCLDGKTTFPFLSNGKYVACKRCLLVYHLSCVKLYCDFCSIQYYTSLNNDSREETNSNIQPATWDKYHCNIVFNDQMKCIQCKEKLYFNIKDNMLICLKCNFTSDPNSILWKCIICSMEFKSGVKIYNPLEYKMFKNLIKEAIVKCEYAKPEKFPCGHGSASDSIAHKSDCEGKLLIGYYYQSKMIVCDKCNVVALYEKFIWTCPLCSRRFREMTSDKKIISYINNNNNNSINANDEESLSSYYSTNESGTTLDRMSTLNLKGSTIDDSKDTSIIEKRQDKLILNCSIQQIKSLPPMKITSDLPKINLDSYMIISEIAEGATSKIFCVKDDDNEFFALKKLTYNKKLIKSCELHYSIKSNDIIQFKGISIDKSQNELNVLLELGLCDLEKEITSRRRLKRDYSEIELISISYQISSALCYLQMNGYVHWNIRPCNIIMFKDEQYKLGDIAHIRKISENIWDKGNNDNTDNTCFSAPKTQRSNMIKADVYCLGLTMIYITTLAYQSVEDIMALDYPSSFSSSQKDNTVNDNIKKILHSNLFSKDRYSDKYGELLFNMINANVNERYDFVDVLNFITTNYSH